MKKMIQVSLVINVMVLVPVSAGLLLDMPWVLHGYGPISPARGILLSIYGALLLLSLGLLFIREPLLVAPLLMVQVLYKLSTPFTVGSWSNPVVISNILIAIIHTFTLVLIWRDGEFVQLKHRR